MHEKVKIRVVHTRYIIFNGKQKIPIVIYASIGFCYLQLQMVHTKVVICKMSYISYTKKFQQYSQKRCSELIHKNKDGA